MKGKIVAKTLHFMNKLSATGLRTQGWSPTPGFSLDGTLALLQWGARLAGWYALPVCLPACLCLSPHLSSHIYTMKTNDTYLQRRNKG